MHRIPRSRFGGHEIRTFIESRHFVPALIVGRRAAVARNLADPQEAVLAVNRDLRIPHRFTGFIEDSTAQYRIRRKSQSEVRGIDVRACHNRGGELVVLIVGSGNESALCPLQRELSRRDVKFKTSIVGGYDILDIFSNLRICNRDARTRQRTSALGIHNPAGNPVRPARDFPRLGIRSLGLDLTKKRKGVHTARAPAARVVENSSSSFAIRSQGSVAIAHVLSGRRSGALRVPFHTKGLHGFRIPVFEFRLGVFKSEYLIGARWQWRRGETSIRSHPNFRELPAAVCKWSAVDVGWAQA